MVQIEWLKKNANHPKLETAFNKKFGENRSIVALKWQLRKHGVFVPKFAQHKVGDIVRKKDWMIVTSINPTRFKAYSRFMWEKLTGEKLTNQDTIYHIDGNGLNVELSNMLKMSRCDAIRFNLLPKTIPFETRLLMSKINAKIGELTGRGTWSEEEVEWLIKERRKGLPFSSIVKPFNKRFNKNRTVQCLTAKYHLRGK